MIYEREAVHRRYQNDVVFYNLVNGLEAGIRDGAFKLGDVMTAVRFLQERNVDVVFREAMEYHLGVGKNAGG